MTLPTLSREFDSRYPLQLYRRTRMLELAIAFAAGLIVGWNFLPQPATIKNMISKITG